jgi:hypothetical protein
VKYVVCPEVLERQADLSDIQLEVGLLGLDIHNMCICPHPQVHQVQRRSKTWRKKVTMASFLITTALFMYFLAYIFVKEANLER